MITTVNKRRHDGGIDTIKDRAAHLVQSMEGCPIEDVLRALVIFDKYNSPNTTNRNAKRWLYEFCGYESASSGKKMDPLIHVENDGVRIAGKHELQSLLLDYGAVA